MIANESEVRAGPFLSVDNRDTRRAGSGLSKKNTQIKKQADCHARHLPDVVSRWRMASEVFVISNQLSIRTSTQDSTSMTRLLFLISLSFALPAASSLAEETPAPGKQVELTLSDEAGDVGYLLYLPREYDADKEQAWPLLLFLHGRGESNGPLSLVTKWGPPRFAQRGDDLPFILVSPQCPKDGRWSDDTRQKQLGKLLDTVETTYRVDKDRIILTGLSMGGYGSWSLAAKHPDRFAVVVPVCGGGDPQDAEKLKFLPIWVFHGDQDKAVPLSRSVEMVEAIQGVGGTKIRLTTLEHVGHNSWSSAYALPELYEWMLKQKASANK